MNKLLKNRIFKRFGVFVLLFACFLMTGRTSVYGAQSQEVSAYLPVDQKFTAVNTQDGEPEDRFTYCLTAEDPNSPMPEGSDAGRYTFDLNGNQQFQIGPVEYTHGGVYHYTLSPVVTDEKEYYTYDRSVYNITVYVKNTGSGELTTLVVMENASGEKVDQASFAHSFKGPEPVSETEPETQPQTEETQAPPQAKPGEIPKTGDTMNLPLWAGMLAVSAGVIIFAAVRKKKTQEEENN